MRNNTSLWPSFAEVPDIRTPKAILMEQAAFLESATKKVLTVKVTTHPVTIQRPSGKTDAMQHKLVVTAPYIGNYSAEIVMLQHNIFLYPVKVANNLSKVSGEAGDEEGLITLLADVFNSQEIRNLIISLLAQSKAAIGENKSGS